MIEALESPEFGNRDHCCEELEALESHECVDSSLEYLIENAVDFARERVEIVARWSAQEVTLTITDDGAGIPLDVLDAVGEPYTTRGTPRAGQISRRRQVQVALRVEVDLATHMAADAAVGRHLDDQLLGPQVQLVARELEARQPAHALEWSKSAGVPNSGALPSLTPGVDGSSTGGW